MCFVCCCKSVVVDVFASFRAVASQFVLSFVSVAATVELFVSFRPIEPPFLRFCIVAHNGKRGPRERGCSGILIASAGKAGTGSRHCPSTLSCVQKCWDVEGEAYIYIIFFWNGEWYVCCCSVAGRRKKPRMWAGLRNDERMV